MGRPKTEAATYTSMMVRLPKDMLEKFRVRATKERRSLNAQFLCVLEDWLEEEEEKNGHELVGARTD
jgi:plasmid stability protein